MQLLESGYKQMTHKHEHDVMLHEVCAFTKEVRPLPKPEAMNRIMACQASMSKCTLAWDIQCTNPRQGTSHWQAFLQNLSWMDSKQQTPLHDAGWLMMLQQQRYKHQHNPNTFNLHRRPDKDSRPAHLWSFLLLYNIWLGDPLDTLDVPSE